MAVEPRNIKFTLTFERTDGIREGYPVRYVTQRISERKARGMSSATSSFGNRSRLSLSR